MTRVLGAAIVRTKSASSNALSVIPDLIAQTSVSYRSARDGHEKTLKLNDIASAALGGADPWRTFRWVKGQKHYSGTYWSATEAGHVIYESRLELARLLYADFDKKVNRIVAQPFLLTAKINGQVRRHIPDFLLLTDTGPVVIDVKPQHRLADPKVSSTFAWTRTVVSARGWRYEVASEPPVIELANIRFLAGYRRPHLVDDALARQVRAAGIDGATLAGAMTQVGGPLPQVRATILHLIWTQEIVVDTTQPLTSRTMLRRRTP
jgi:TnsA endonuclease N terminal